MKENKSRIAIVVQRYGLEINGGAELHARLLAERLKSMYEVEILTTCAKDYQTWDNYYDEGVEEINQIKVRRFKSQKKNLGRFIRIGKYVHYLHKYRSKKITLLNCFYVWYKRLKYKLLFDFNEWVEVQGPHCEGLISFIRSTRNDFDVFIFFTYLYYPTCVGIKEVANKSILIPTAHDEPAFYLKGYAPLFSMSKFIMYNMQSEKDLVESVYPQAKKVKSAIAGIGFDKPMVTDLELQLDKKFFVYIGRMKTSKGCDALMEYFTKFLTESNADVMLVFIGENVQHYKESKNMKFLGFVEENVKNYYLQKAEALIIPSLFESLSLVTLEAMQLGTPVIANRKCEVLKNHIEESSAGYLFENYQEFKEVVNKVLLLDTVEKNTIYNNGIRYVERNYNWNAVMSKFNDAVEFIKAH